ncbi:MAG: S8 family serine peptidase, partial [Bacteroidota bacterium]
GDNNFVSEFVDGMAYIFEKAAELGMPCVINSSLGYYGGAHDTRGLDVQLVENILNQSPGRALVQACGNGALTNLHLSYNPGVDTSFSWMRHTTTFGQVVFEAFADEADFNDVWLKMGIRRRNTFEFYGETPFVNVLNDFNLPNNYSVDSLVADLVTDQDSFRVKLTVQRVDGVYEMLFEAFETNNDHFLELTLTGNGDFDIWSHKGLMGTSTIVNQASLIPDPVDYPAIIDFVLPDTLKTIVGGWNCSPEVISVANYSNADSWDTWNGGFVQNSVPYQALVWDSSTGPTRTDDQKPDIAASGNFTYSAATLANLDLLKINFPDKVSPEGWHASFSGTSAAAPVVAGAIACYLELFPETDHLTIKSELEQTAKVDNFVLLKGTTPNLGFGYGKLDAYQFIRSRINYGCTDPNATNYDPDANFEDGSCDFSTAVMELEALGIQLSVQPNPTADQAWINYDLGMYAPTNYMVYDYFGRQVLSGQIENSAGQFQLDLSNKAPGLYLFQLSLDGIAVESIKLIRK